MARNQTPHPRSHKHSLQHYRASRTVQGLIQQLQKRHQSRGRLEFREVIHAEELGDGEEPGSEEADGDGAHDGDGDLAFGMVDFFGEVGGAVEAGEGIVGVYEADYEC